MSARAATREIGPVRAGALRTRSVPHGQGCRAVAACTLLGHAWPMSLLAAYSTVSAASIAETVDRCYAIGPVVGCRLYLRSFNDTYELTGADGCRYMARLCDRRFRGPANIAYEMALIQHLQRSGLVVGAPVVDRDGRFWRLLDAPEGSR